MTSQHASTAASVERILARYALTRADVLRVVVFIGDRSLIRALYDYVRGMGPAAVAAGRVGVRTTPVAAPGAAAAVAVAASSRRMKNSSTCSEARSR